MPETGDLKKLFMVLLGCRPPGRFTEQHDIFFGIGNSLKELVPEINASWPEAKKKIHVDAFREVNSVDGYAIEITERSEAMEVGVDKLFFINLGGYKAGEFDEFHYKMLTVAKTQSEAIRLAKQTAFYKHTGFKGAPSHIDDKYGIDVDDIFQVSDILPMVFKERYSIRIVKKEMEEDELFLGYFPLKKVKDEF
ncbi:DUF1543 domain-containing protein [Dyadobacter sp. CY345]|uniref:DUF1543 domain-containing protein n=1 Tax=Dyadobacter sp. CY345 TaxID=2909335 RepID=UPI001F284357|nr:DUF1543 domain-containing protein [Dyadobacter sp. CY345]MCF2447177.1 DUF1543 domain-containing protein [Dyadobacter sp. CY345]